VDASSARDKNSKRRTRAKRTNDGLKALTDMHSKTHKHIKRRTGRDQVQPDSRVDAESANDGLKAPDIQTGKTPAQQEIRKAREENGSACLTDKHMEKHKHSWARRTSQNLTRG
jgi:hypothetical protein